MVYPNGVVIVNQMFHYLKYKCLMKMLNLKMEIRTAWELTEIIY